MIKECSAQLCAPDHKFFHGPGNAENRPSCRLLCLCKPVSVPGFSKRVGFLQKISDSLHCAPPVHCIASGIITRVNSCLPRDKCQRTVIELTPSGEAIDEISNPSSSCMMIMARRRGGIRSSAFHTVVRAITAASGLRPAPAISLPPVFSFLLKRCAQQPAATGHAECSRVRGQAKLPQAWHQPEQRWENVLLSKTCPARGREHRRR